MIKDIFENSNEKLKTLIGEKLKTVNANKNEQERAETELNAIKDKKDAHLFLFLYEITKYMRENGIYFGTRGLFYTSFYCCYLLDILEYNPMDYSLSVEGYLSGKGSLYLDVEDKEYEKVIGFLRKSFSDNQFFRLAVYDEESDKWIKHAVSFVVLRNGKHNDMETVKVNGENAIKKPADQVWRNENYFIFSLLRLKAIDFIKKAEKDGKDKIDYKNFKDKEVFEFMENVQLDPPFYSCEKIKKLRPKTLRELVFCSYLDRLKEISFGHWVSYGIHYYKLSYIKKYYNKDFEE